MGMRQKQSRATPSILPAFCFFYSPYILPASYLEPVLLTPDFTSLFPCLIYYLYACIGKFRGFETIGLVFATAAKCSSNQYCLDWPLPWPSSSAALWGQLLSTGLHSRPLLQLLTLHKRNFAPHPQSWCPPYNEGIWSSPGTCFFFLLKKWDNVWVCPIRLVELPCQKSLTLSWCTWEMNGLSEWVS